MTHEIHLTADEVAEACRQYAATKHLIADLRYIMGRAHFGAPIGCIPTASLSQSVMAFTDAVAELRGATVRMGGGK